MQIYVSSIAGCLFFMYTFLTFVEYIYQVYSHNKQQLDKRTTNQISWDILKKLMIGSLTLGLKFENMLPFPKFLQHWLEQIV